MFRINYLDRHRLAHVLLLFRVLVAGDVLAEGERGRILWLEIVKRFQEGTVA